MATYALNTDKLRAVASEAGDKSLYRISKRTGLNLGNLSKIVRREWGPSLDTVMRLAAAYRIPVEQLVTTIDEDAPGLQAIA